jgi:hypothetical protein
MWGKLQLLFIWCSIHLCVKQTPFKGRTLRHSESSLLSARFHSLLWTMFLFQFLKSLLSFCERNTLTQYEASLNQAHNTGKWRRKLTRGTSIFCSILINILIHEYYDHHTLRPVSGGLVYSWPVISHILSDIAHILRDIAHILSDIAHILNDIAHILSDIAHILSECSTP